MRKVFKEVTLKVLLEGLSSDDVNLYKLWKSMSYNTKNKFIQWGGITKGDGYGVIENACCGYELYRGIINRLILYLKKHKTFTLHPKIIYDITRFLYDLIKQGSQIKYFHKIENVGCGLTEGFDDYTSTNKVTWDHFNIPQIVFGFMINEYIWEGKKYSFEQFFKMWYELSKVNGVLSKENDKLNSKYCRNKRYNKRYEDEGVVLLNDKFQKIDSTATFSKFLIGSKKNRKYTWVRWEKDAGLWSKYDEYLINKKIA
jgi:hypothetical protein